MRLVAIIAGRHMAMLFLMTGGTGQTAVIAREILQLLPLVGVAGQTGVRKILAEGDLQGLVRIFVTAQTAVDAVMRGLRLRVAEAAGGDDFQLVGRMTVVAIQAIDAAFVGHTGRLDIPGYRAVTLAAIVDGKRRFLRQSHRRQITDPPAICRQDQTETSQKKEYFYSHLPLRGQTRKKFFTGKTKKSINFKDIKAQKKVVRKTNIHSAGQAYIYCRVGVFGIKKCANILPLFAMTHADPRLSWRPACIYPRNKGSNQFFQIATA
jgi:hypothetical protein